MSRRHAVDGGAQRQRQRDVETVSVAAPVNPYLDACADAARLLNTQIKAGNAAAAHLAAILLGQSYLTDEQEAAA